MALLVVMTRVNLMTSHPYWNVAFKCRNSPCSFHRFIMYVTVCYRSALTSACRYNEIKSNGFFFSIPIEYRTRSYWTEKWFFLVLVLTFFFSLKKREKCVQNVVMRWIIFGIKVQLFYWTINFSYIIFLFIFCFHIHRSLLIIPVLLCLWCRLSTDSSLMGFLAIALSCQFF